MTNGSSATTTDASELTVGDDRLAAVYDAHYVGLVRLARLLGDPSDAEDVVQSAFLRVMRRGRLREPDLASAYLRQTVINLTRSHHRREERAVRREQRAAPPESVSMPDVATSISLQRALIELPRRQREAVVLRYFSDLTEQATADLMGISVGAVKAYTSRGLDRLGDILGDQS